MRYLHKIIFIALFSAMSHSTLAQVKVVDIDTNGEMLISVELPGRNFIVVDQRGEVYDVEAIGLYVDHYSNFHQYNAGKIKKVGDVEFEYYSDFYDYNTGKIKRIGSVDFSYHSNFHDYKAGKIEQIGSVKIDYHSNFHDYEVGKIKSIGRNRYSYSKSFGLKSGVMSFVEKGIRFNIVKFE